MLKIIKILKKIPIDFNQYELRDKSKAKKFAFDLAKLQYKSNYKALDIGCRDGYWSEKLKSIGYDVRSIDLDKSYISTEIVNADNILPFENNSFDLIWASEVLEHLKNPYFSVNEMKRILKPGGKIIITTPNSSCWVFKLFEFLGFSVNETQNPDHKQFFSYDDMKRLFPKGCIYGYFPYLIIKKIIRNGKIIGLLSPTFMVCDDK